MVLLLVIAVFTLCVCVLKLLLQTHIKNYPPGPRGLPIFGNVFQLIPNQYEAYSNFRKKYGDIFSVQLGSIRSVVVNDYTLMKDVFMKPEFYGRPFSNLLFTHSRVYPVGLGFSEGKVWSELRQFHLKHSRTLGFGDKEATDYHLQQDTAEVITALKARTGVPIDLREEFAAATMNYIWNIVTGERFLKSDPEFMELRKALSEILQDNETSKWTMRFPWLKYLPLARHREFVKNSSDILDVIRRKVTQHKNNITVNVNPDLIACYLQKIKETTDPQSNFYKSLGELNMIHSLSDMTFFGTETTGVGLSWIALCMAHYTEKQNKLFEEIKAIVGLTDAPSLAVRNKMPYTQAVIMEVLRYTRFVPQTFRTAIEDTVFHGYNIPKGTAVFANFTEVMKDPNVWGDPHNFRPERFLSEDGKDIVRHEAFIFFSIGKRACPGETFAKDQLFLFTTNLFQQFIVELDTNNKYSFEGEFGILTTYPKHDKLILRNRESNNKLE